MIIRILRNTTGRPAWKLADASLVFTDDDDPRLNGLVLSGFTIGTSKVEPGALNITVPSRDYTATGLDGKPIKRTWTFLRALHAADQDTLIQNLLVAIKDAYEATLTKDPDP